MGGSNSFLENTYTSFGGCQAQIIAQRGLKNFFRKPGGVENITAIAGRGDTLGGPLGGLGAKKGPEGNIGVKESIIIPGEKPPGE